MDNGEPAMELRTEFPNHLVVMHMEKESTSPIAQLRDFWGCCVTPHLSAMIHPQVDGTDTDNAGSYFPNVSLWFPKLG